MTIQLNQSLGDSLKNLLTSTQRQSREVAFNLQFQTLQNTTIDRLNKEIIEVEDVNNRQGALNRLQASADELTDRRREVVQFEYFNSSNNQRFNDIETRAITASIVAQADGDTSAFSASEVAALQEDIGEISIEINRLVELNDGAFFDGDHPTALIAKLEELESLSLVEGTVDASGTASEDATNDNRRALDLLDEISDLAGAAANTSATLNLMADNVIAQIDRELNRIKVDSNEISLEQAIEIEFEVQRLKTKYATFLQAIEIGFDFASQSANRLADAMDPDNFTSGTVLSYTA